MLEFISQPWAWYVAGPAIAVIMLLLIYFGKNLGVSSSMRTLCSVGGAGKKIDFFRFDWKSQIWNLVFIVGAIVGGFIASTYFPSTEPIKVASETAAQLNAIGLSAPNSSLLPPEFFSWESLFTLEGIIVLGLGGFLVGFGARYAGGCTSGHAISGISNLQIPSMIAVLGFFIGGVIMTHFLLPLITRLS
jgi:uncharacterized membrane protein YedE/YeeE